MVPRSNFNSVPNSRRVTHFWMCLHETRVGVSKGLACNIDQTAGHGSVEQEFVTGHVYCVVWSWLTALVLVFDSLSKDVHSSMIM